ncbi:RNA-binding family protein isoform 2 [Hibiscus syriacus]|uniref:RNA-binding family protein isoform 2 n=1 Tax=Hibiscus syriacus TaxID=106335 RepID=A0A6A2XB11_HIBSY|nr:RNA-binding family protein isoform 2 [Hibiscus syriacus]
MWVFILTSNAFKNFVNTFLGLHFLSFPTLPMDPRGGESLPDAQTNHFRSSDHLEDDKSNPHTGDGASPGKIFVGGLARETSSAQFLEHFGKYGEITDSVIMKDRKTGQPRGFGFVTYAEPSVVDKVIEDTHVINGKQVEIKRTIPKGAAGSKDFKTRKIFVGGIPSTVSEDEFKDFFTQYGEVREHQNHAGSCHQSFPWFWVHHF